MTSKVTPISTEILSYEAADTDADADADTDTDGNTDANNVGIDVTNQNLMKI